MAAAVRIDVIDRALEHMFRRVLRDVTGEPPQLDEVRIYRDEHRAAIRIRAQFKVQGQPDRFVEQSISQHELMSQRESINLGRTFYNADVIWSRCYEDHYVRRMIDEGSRLAVEAAAHGRLEEAQAIIEQTRGLSRRALGNGHRLDFEREYMQQVAIDRDIVEVYQPRRETATETRLRLDETARRLEQNIERHLMSSYAEVTSTTSEASEPLTAARIMETIQALGMVPVLPELRDFFVPQSMRTVDGRFYVDFGANSFSFGGSIEVGTKEAQTRGLQLLKDNLTPEQRDSYEKNKYFDVKGGESGTTYRIRHGRQMNIEVLNGKGQRDHGICFLPIGSLVAGDCMLAQKTALELYESEALKIANRFG